jgi:hypothetical protein
MPLRRLLDVWQDEDLVGIREPFHFVGFARRVLSE